MTSYKLVDRLIQKKKVAIISDSRNKQEPEVPGAAKLNRERQNVGDWNPFVDWRDVFAGNRGVDRDGNYGLFDAPIGIKLEIEESNESEPFVNRKPSSMGDGSNYAARARSIET